MKMASHITWAVKTSGETFAEITWFHHLSLPSEQISWAFNFPMIFNLRQGVGNLEIIHFKCPNEQRQAPTAHFCPNCAYFEQGFNNYDSNSQSYSWLLFVRLIKVHFFVEIYTNLFNISFNEFLQKNYPLNFSPIPGTNLYRLSSSMPPWVP